MSCEYTYIIVGLFFTEIFVSTWVPRFWGFQTFQIQVQVSPRNYPTNKVFPKSSNQIFWVDSTMNHPLICSLTNPNALGRWGFQKWLAKCWFHWRNTARIISYRSPAASSKWSKSINELRSIAAIWNGKQHVCSDGRDADKLANDTIDI